MQLLRVVAKVGDGRLSVIDGVNARTQDAAVVFRHAGYRKPARVSAASGLRNLRQAQRAHRAVLADHDLLARATTRFNSSGQYGSVVVEAYLKAKGGQEAVRLDESRSDRPDLWFFRDTLYTAPHGLEPLDVTALLLESENKVKVKVARAKATLAQSQLPTARPRPPISDEVKIFVWQRDEGRCVRCRSKEDLHYDHIIPHSKGGSTTARNLQLLCEPCNLAKGPNLA